MPRSYTHIVDYDPNRFAALLTLEESCSARIRVGLIHEISRWPCGPAELLEHITDLYKNFRGRFYDPNKGFIDPQTGLFNEVYVDMTALENTPYEWWRDTLGPNAAPVNVIRIRMESIPRWRAIGSIYRACFPAEFQRILQEPANIDQPPHV